MIISDETTAKKEASASGSVDIPRYRLKRGTKLSDITSVPPALSTLNGPFQLAEYLALLVKHDPHDIETLIKVPNGDASLGGKAPEKDVWIYEHLRRIPIDLTPLIISLLPTCTKETCPQMKADEWLYLCVAHGGGQTEECCAIDYILHTLDSTTTLLNSSKSFPSRLSIPPASLTHFASLFRRLSRIFSHAYFHHRESFQLAESETSLYTRFVALCERYELVGPGLLVIPNEAVGKYTKSHGHGNKRVNGAEAAEDEDETEEGEDEEEFSRKTNTTNANKSQSLSPNKSKSDIPTNDNAETIRDNSRSGGITGGMTIGRGTLGRGKQPRATMLWAAADDTPHPPPPVQSLSTSTGSTVDSSQKTGIGMDEKGEAEPAQASAPGLRSRSESIQSVIHIPHTEESLSEEEVKTDENSSEDPQIEDEQKAQAELVAQVEKIPSPLQDTEPEQVEETTSVAAGEEAEGEEDEETVPKDEIELLEEEGKLDPESTVDPLPHTVVGGGSDGGEDEVDELEEVELHEEVKSQVEPEAETVSSLPSTESDGKGSSTSDKERKTSIAEKSLKKDITNVPELSDTKGKMISEIKSKKENVEGESVASDKGKVAAIVEEAKGDDTLVIE